MEVDTQPDNLAEDSLDDPIVGSSITLVIHYELNEFGIPVETGSSEATPVTGRHRWVPGYSAAETNW